MSCSSPKQFCRPPLRFNRCLAQGIRREVQAAKGVATKLWQAGGASSPTDLGRCRGVAREMYLLEKSFWLVLPFLALHDGESHLQNRSWLCCCFMDEGYGQASNLIYIYLYHVYIIYIHIYIYIYTYTYIRGHHIFVVTTLASLCCRLKRAAGRIRAPLFCQLATAR